MRRILFVHSFVARISLDRVAVSSIVALALCALLLPPPLAAQTSFGTVNLGGSASATATVTISSAGTLNTISVVTQGAANLDFTQNSGGTCTAGQAYAATATCTVKVTFTPKFAGGRNGAVVLADAGNNVLGSAYLQGSGSGPQLTYNLGSFGPFATIPATLTGSPTALAMDDTGNIYIADGGTTGTASPGARVVKETLSSGNYVQSVVASGFYQIPNIGIDGAGNLYVLDLGAGSNTNTNYVYKETLFNGQYQQSTINISPTAISVDGAGNIYYFGGQDTTGAGIYALLLQPDGTYAAGNGELPQPDPNSIVVNWTCGLEPPPPFPDLVESFSADGNGNLYFYSFVGCTSQYEQPRTYLGLFEYSAGITQTPTTLLASQVTLQEYIPLAEILLDARANIFYIQGSGPLPFLSEASAAGPGLPLPVLPSSMVATALATDGGGDVVIVGNISGSEAIYQLEYANPLALNFQATPINVESADSPKSMMVVNISAQAANISSITYPTDFPEDPATGFSGPCANAAVLSGADNFCTLFIDFIPQQSLGNQSTLRLSENVTLNTNLAAPAWIAVTGTEILPYAATPVPSVASGTYTSVQTVALSDSTAGASIFYTTDGTMPTISSIPYAGPITVSQSETIEAIAAASGFSASSALSAVYTINLPLTFNLSATPPSLSIGEGGSGTVSVSVAPQNGFSSTVTFECSGLPSGATCSFSPETVTPAGAAASTTLTISAAASASSMAVANYRPLLPIFPAAMLVMGLCGIAWTRRSRTRLAFALLGVALATGCGGSSSSMTTKSTKSTVTITAISGSLQQSTTISLTVQ